MPRIESVIDPTTGEVVQRDTSKAFDTPEQVDEWNQRRRDEKYAAEPILAQVTT